MLQKSVLLKDHSNYKIGGFADYFFEFNSIDELKLAISEYKEIDSSLSNVFILGKGTNVLFSDAGFRGLILKNNLNGINKEGNIIEVGSGVLFDELNNFAISNSLSGFEWAGGLPGTVGGAVRGNAGAYGGETKDNLLEVKGLDLNTLEVKTRNNNECGFGYRNSIFKSGEESAQMEIILSAKFEMKSADSEEIKRNTQEKIDHRKSRHPLEYPNIGSTFKNIPVENVPIEVLKQFENNIKQDPFPVLPVAKLIVASDLVGRRIGDAKISEKHPNFIVNLGNASSEDVLALIDLVKKSAKDKFDISLDEEIMII